MKNNIKPKRRRGKNVKLATLVGSVFILTLLIGIFLFIRIGILNSGYEMDPSEYLKVRYTGFNGDAKAEIEVDRAGILAEMEMAYANYETAIWPITKDYSLDDFIGFGEGVSAKLDKISGISNGDEINITVVYDFALANDLGIEIPFGQVSTVVDSLEEGVYLNDEAIFDGVSLEVDGISPMLTVELKCDSKEAYSKFFSYYIENPKEYYENGDKVQIAVSYDKNALAENNYAIDSVHPSKEIKLEEYTEYVSRASQIDSEVLEKAIELGKQYFADNANEYGLRIFTAAHLKYTWEGTGDYTFRWSDPQALSAYLEVKNSESLSDTTKPYNYLEIPYTVHISQANGVGCQAEGVVCFDSLTIDSMGNVDINEESGQLFSASFKDKEIKNVLKGWFGSDYDLIKLME